MNKLAKSRNLHTGEIRFFSGTYPVRELPQKDWGNCKRIYLTAERIKTSSMRGYVAYSDGPEWKNLDTIRLPSQLVYTKKTKNKVERNDNN